MKDEILAAINLPLNGNRIKALSFGFFFLFFEPFSLLHRTLSTVVCCFCSYEWNKQPRRKNLHVECKNKWKWHKNERFVFKIYLRFHLCSHIKSTALCWCARADPLQATIFIVHINHERENFRLSAKKMFLVTDERRGEDESESWEQKGGSLTMISQGYYDEDNEKISFSWWASRVMRHPTNISWWFYYISFRKKRGGKGSEVWSEKSNLLCD